MTDLKLIDELLIDMKQLRGVSFEQLANDSSVAREAMERLRNAWFSGEMESITVSLARHFSQQGRALIERLKIRASEGGEG